MVNDIGITHVQLNKKVNAMKQVYAACRIALRVVSHIMSMVHRIVIADCRFHIAYTHHPRFTQVPPTSFPEKTAVFRD